MNFDFPFSLIIVSIEGGEFFRIFQKKKKAALRDNT